MRTTAINKDEDLVVVDSAKESHSLGNRHTGQGIEAELREYWVGVPARGWYCPRRRQQLANGDEGCSDDPWSTVHRNGNKDPGHGGQPMLQGRGA